MEGGRGGIWFREFELLERNCKSKKLVPLASVQVLTLAGLKWPMISESFCAGWAEGGPPGGGGGGFEDIVASPSAQVESNSRKC